VTRPREAILELFAESSGHLSAEDVYLRLARTHPGLSLATVYRTLDVLHELNLLTRHRFGDGRARYELAPQRPGEHAHYHLICSDCGKVINREIGDNDVLAKLESELQVQHGFDVRSRRVEFVGLCPDCLSARRRKNLEGS
jgi:Fur family ferric uptake transcriptional regulator